MGQGGRTFGLKCLRYTEDTTVQVLLEQNSALLCVRNVCPPGTTKVFVPQCGVTDRRTIYLQICTGEMQDMYRGIEMRI